MLVPDDRVPGAKLFFPEEMPELIAEEAIGLWVSESTTFHCSRRRAAFSFSELKFGTKSKPALTTH